jgi:hypothetical protein
VVLSGDRVSPDVQLTWSADMAGNRMIRAVTVAVAALGGALAAPSLAVAQVPAGVGPTAIAGYAWSGATNGYYTYDSTGRTASIEGDGTGSYFAIFPGLQDIKGEHVDVSTYGPGGACLQEGTQALATALFISVDCYSSGGALADSAFDVVVTKPTRAPGGVFDYDLVPPARSGKLTGSGQYNSARKANSVEHLGTGRYQVTMPGPAATGATGTAAVTDVDHGPPGGCELAGWHGTKSGQVIDVDCFALSGARQNRTFGVSYVAKGNLLGIGGITSAYAYADRPAATVYQPSTQYDSVRGASVVIIRQSRGTYLVIPAGSAGPSSTSGGDVEVNAVGTTDDRCYVGSWAQAVPPEISIDCVNSHGAKADSSFTVEWTVA